MLHTVVAWDSEASIDPEEVAHFTADFDKFISEPVDEGRAIKSATVVCGNPLEEEPAQYKERFSIEEQDHHTTELDRELKYASDMVW